MPAKTGWRRQPDEKRIAAYDCSRQQAVGDEATLSALRAARRRRRQRHRQRVRVHKPRWHHGRERWQPAAATDQDRSHETPGHAMGAVVQHKRSRRVHRSKAAPGPAVAGSIRQCRGTAARFRSGRHAASRRRAARGQARQSPSARQAAVLWPAYRRARHRDGQGLA